MRFRVISVQSNRTAEGSLCSERITSISKFSTEPISLQKLKAGQKRAHFKVSGLELKGGAIRSYRRGYFPLLG